MTSYEAIQRNSFGSFYVKSTDLNKLSFYAYQKTDADNIEFKKIHDTDSAGETALLGSPEVYWWP